MPEPVGGSRLSDLEGRWKFDRSPRIFLQLADELRRAGNSPRAIQILQDGLANHPESVSGRVALGRLQLEVGDALAATETLERALARDPAQIVASKLLIAAWIKIGDAARARERLDIYRILQQRDSEIEEYERRIASMERTERAAAQPPGVEAEKAPPSSGTSGEPGAKADELVLAEVPPSGAGDTESGKRWPQGAPVPAAVEASSPAQVGAASGALFRLDAPAELPPIDLLAVVPSPAPISAGRAGSTAHSVLDRSSPFGRLFDPVASEQRIVARLRSEALFVPLEPRASASVEPLEAPLAPVVPVAEVLAAAELPIAPAVDGFDELQARDSPPPDLRPVADAVVDSTWSSSESAAPADLAPKSWSSLELGADEGLPVAPFDAAAPAEPTTVLESFSTTGFADEVERESLVEPLADVLSRAGVDASALPPIELDREPEGAESASAERFDFEAFSTSMGARNEAVVETAAVPPLAVAAEIEVEASAVATESGEQADLLVEVGVTPNAIDDEAPSATLGRLYLEQGHLEDAEAQFQRVLALRPGDPAASAGLTELARLRADEATAAGWSEPVEAPPRGPRPLGLTQRKVETLRDYLERVRRARARLRVS